ncbi:helix-turn-helix transcriptional regulator [Emticicia sp. C21]|uniref:helix-turn-helix domain-containing protein n=1 Tax=Emticicia sp. C21 TaxID=2302915 RepID=UPI001E52BE24
MAEMLDISILAYGNIERGKTKVSEERLQQIAEKFGVSPDDILGFSDKVNNFFDQCSGPIGVLSDNVHQTNNYDARELQHENEKLQLQIEKLNLEIEKISLEKEKAELELKYFREKIVSNN